MYLPKLCFVVLVLAALAITACTKTGSYNECVLGAVRGAASPESVTTIEQTCAREYRQDLPTAAWKSIKLSVVVGFGGWCVQAVNESADWNVESVRVRATDFAGGEEAFNLAPYNGSNLESGDCATLPQSKQSNEKPSLHMKILRARGVWIGPSKRGVVAEILSR